MTSPLPGTIGSNLPRVVGLSINNDVIFGIQGGTTKQFPVGLIVSAASTANIFTCTTVTAAGDYDVLTSDQIVYLTGAHTRNVFLPAASVMEGKSLWIKVDVNGATNTQTITPNGLDTIEGLASVALSGSYQWVLIYAQGPGLWLLFT